MKAKSTTLDVRSLAKPVLAEAASIVVNDTQTLTFATSLLSELNKHLDRVTAEKEKVTRPLNEALKAERTRWKPLEDSLNASISDLRLKMSQYASHTLKQQEATILSLSERVGEGKGKLSLETAVKKISQVETLPENIETSSGSITFRPIERLKITSRADIPDPYWTLDETALLRALKAGTKVAGAEIIIEQVIVNKR